MPSETTGRSKNQIHFALVRMDGKVYIRNFMNAFS